MSQPAKAHKPGGKGAAQQPPKVKLTKAQKKLLKRLAKIELKKKLIRDQLLREIELTKKSLVRGRLQWEDTCKQIKLKELQNEVTAWDEECEERFQKKDEKINFLMKTISETHELHERNYSKHLDTLEYLQNCSQALHESATVLFETEASELVRDFLWGSNDVADVHEALKLRNENVIHSSNIVAKCRLRKNNEDYLETKFDEVSGEIERRYILRNRTIEKMKTVQENLGIFMKLLEGDMVDVHKTAKFLYLTQRQRINEKESSKLNAIERNCCKKINELKHEWLEIEAESTRRLYALKLEQAYFLDVRRLIKNSIDKNQQFTHDKLLSVASESHGVIQKLKEIVKTGELLLNLGACCRKYQTEKEKVLPWTMKKDSDRESEFMLKMKIDLVKLLDISEEELLGQMNLMKNFWSRCSNVRLHILLLEEDKRKLVEANNGYGNIIRSMKAERDVARILDSIKIEQFP